MKKLYISPGYSFLDVELSTLMATSLSSTLIGDQSVTPEANAEIAGDEFTSRRYGRDLWADEVVDEEF